MRKTFSIRTKFILAFTAVSLIGIGLVAIFTSYFSNQQFENLVINQELTALGQIIEGYYSENGTFIGLDRLIRPAPGEIPPENQPTLRPGIVLTNAAGDVVLGSSVHPPGTSIPKKDLARGITLNAEGQTIGFLVPFNPGINPSPREIEFLKQINTALILASLGAILLGVILALIFTRSLLQPLAELNQGIKQMQAGELAQKIDKVHHDELGEVIMAFNQMSTAIAEANQRREQMTADIAHELRSPLTVISGYLEALEDGSLSASPARIKTIKHEVDQLNRLVEDLRTLALADAGQLTLLKAQISPKILFDHLQESFHLMADEKQIQIITETAQDLQPFYIDKGRVLQALTNLMSNALRYTPAGGRIKLKAAQSPELDIIYIQDTGQGIPPDALDHLFERFYRVDPARQANAGETGLGLSIVKAIVEAHGGWVSVESQIGQGTRFALFFPQGH